MAWGRFGDTSHSHRKVLRAMAKDSLRGATVWGVVTLCLSWSTQESQDWWVSESFVRRTWGPAGLKVMREAQACGLVKPGRQRRDGENGWLIDDSDPDLLHIRTREEVDRDREKSRATRQKEATRHVRLRDGDQCRYCGKTVDWKDRTSGRAGTYDHPDPGDRDTFVVACKACNTAKYNRTVEQWTAAGGRQLLPPPDEPLIGPKTAEQFDVPPSTRAHPDPTPDDAATARADTSATAATPAESAATRAPGPAGELDLELADPTGADLPASGRDGPRSGRARDGSVTAGDPPPAPDARPRDGPARRRGSRGRRRRPPPPATSP